jgi:hypothetical protein
MVEVRSFAPGAGEHRTGDIAAAAKFRQVATPVQRGDAQSQEHRSPAPRFSASAVAAAPVEEMTMTRFLALIAATLLAFAAQAGDKDKTHDTGMKSTATFDALDKNADSQISKTEASADSKLSDNFAALDTNGDGYLSKAEFVARGKT